MGAAGAGSVALGAIGLRAQGWPPFDGERKDDVRGTTWTEPSVVESRGGLLELELRAAVTDVTIAGATARMLSYNGSVPGPTLHLRPGDRIRVRLVNDLDKPTNLHTHGLLVSPEDNGDNPFLSIGPGEAFDYNIHLPDDHPAGVFWYHPHRHGLVADQVFGGLYGAIVVDDEDWSGGAPRVAVVSDTTLSRGGVADVSAMDRMQGRLGQTVLVNGHVAPRLAAPGGSSERLLIINACVSRYLDLDFGGREMTVRGFDSGAFVPPFARKRVLVPPGGRVDLDAPVADAPTGLVARAYDIGGMGMMRGGGADPADATLFTIVPGVAARRAPSPASSPSPSPPRDLRGATVDRARTLTLSMGMGGGGMSFTIDGRTFDGARIDHEVELGAIEEWTLRNTSTMAHPFHLHTWPMQLMGDNSEGQVDIRDVVDVPAGQEVTVRIAFDRHSGRTVFHCHILDHEDLGMMGVVEVR
nr:multicopper oxidase family protein [Demequina sp. TTPB684]